MAEKFKFSRLGVIYVALALISSATSEATGTTEASATAPAPTTEAPATTPAPTTKASATTPALTTNISGPTTNASATTPALTTNVSGPTANVSTEIPTTPLPTTTPTPGPCGPQPCGQGSTCQERVNDTFVCLCVPGESYDYNRKVCEKAKVFPGSLTVPGLQYVDAMKNIASTEFARASKNITDDLGPSLNTTGTLINIRVVKLLPVASRQAEGLTADIEIVYSATSTVTQEGVTGFMKKIDCNGCPLEESKFTEGNLCDMNDHCDMETTSCTPGEGTFTCECKEHLIKSNFSERMCIVCKSGQYSKDNIECVNCPFGSTGVSCTEKWQLALVIVASVLGALLVIMLIILLVTSRSAKKKSKASKNVDIGKPYVSHSPAKSPLVFSNGNASLGTTAVPEIPRATVQSSWNARDNYEMSPRNGRQNGDRNMRYPYDDHRDTDLYEFRPKSGPRDQTRPQHNPYEPNRPKMNPYDDKRGGNPYDNRGYN